MSPHRPASPSSPWPRFVLGAACLRALLAGCEPMESRGDIFSPAPRTPVSAPAAAVAPDGTPAASADPTFDFPSEPPLVLSSEEMAKGDLPNAMATAAGVDPTLLLGAEPAVLPPVESPVAAPPAYGVPAASQWPVRLVSTIPQAQPPRAILGLPSGEERVVSPGSILAEQGLVVMAVTGDRVTLARIEAAGDHARIETLEITAQYAPAVATAPTR